MTEHLLYLLQHALQGGFITGCGGYILDLLFVLEDLGKKEKITDT